MSLQNFQSALAYVLRSFDVENIKDSKQLSTVFELSTDEKITLDNIINQQRLKAYSEELFLARWTIIREALDFLGPLINMKAMSDLWEKEFEPQSKHVIHEDLVLKFTEYLITEPSGIEFISNNTPAYMPSLMRYIHTVFTFNHNYLPELKISPCSVLTQRYFKIIKLEYDVREFFSELVEIDDFAHIKLKLPIKKSVKLLFVASDEVTEFRSFEIDDELESFLNNQLKSTNPEKSLISCYDDLADIGLCKPRASKSSCCSKVH